MLMRRQTRSELWLMQASRADIGLVFAAIGRHLSVWFHDCYISGIAFFDTPGLVV